MNAEEGFQIQEVPHSIFAQRWQVLGDYPAEKAARLYAGYARFTGATEDAMRAFQKLTTITEEDIIMATAKKAAAPAVKKSTAVRNEKETLTASVRTGTKAKDLPTGGTSRRPAVKKPAVKKPETKKPAAKKAAPAAKKAAVKDAAPRKPGSGALIRECVLKGWDNEKILAAVAKQFPDSKAGPSDISWNKGKLRKEGHKV